jgi:hypothetical protein
MGREGVDPNVHAFTEDLVHPIARSRQDSP